MQRPSTTIPAAISKAGTNLDTFFISLFIYVMSVIVILFLYVGQYCTQFLVGGSEPSAAFAQQFGGSARIRRQIVYIALIALHQAQYRLQLIDSLSV